jgi:acetate kinase
VAILAVNYGSSSLKTALFAPPGAQGEAPRNLARARVARLSDGHLIVEWDGGRDERQVRGDPLTAIADALGDAGLPVPQAIGHRFVHGGDYAGPELLTPAVLAVLEKLTPWAPQHQPAALGGVADAAKRWPQAPQVGCFDSAFHRTMPEVAQRLPLPSALWDEGIRRYGFHGLNYDHVVHTVGAAELGRAVIAHLGNGSSMAAIEGGRSVDTTMGFTPDAGLFMGSRSGDIDPGVMLYLAGRERDPVPVEGLRQIFQEQSGLRGLSGGESDMAALLARSDAPARLAVDAFIRQVAKQVAAFATVLGGIDTLVFTGGIGEHSEHIRDGVMTRLAMMAIGQVRVVPADEEAVIARQTARVTGRVKDAATP